MCTVARTGFCAAVAVRATRGGGLVEVYGRCWRKGMDIVGGRGWELFEEGNGGCSRKEVGVVRGSG